MDTYLALSVGCAVFSPVLAFGMWLLFCSRTDARHKDTPENTAKIITAAGRWFPQPLRSRASVKPRLLARAGKKPKDPSTVDW
jgi:hypothetical protein